MAIEVKEAVAVEVEEAEEVVLRNRVKVPTTRPKERRTLPRRQDPTTTLLVRDRWERWKK